MGAPYNTQFANLLSRLSTVMSQLGEQMRAKAYKTAEESILTITKNINSIDDLKEHPGIGPTIRSKLQEYIDTGKISVLEREENRPEVVLSKVYGIGPKKAKELVQKGITTIQGLRDNPEVLNDVQRKGLLYYEDILKRIPRDEIVLYDNYFKESITNITKQENTKYEIVGSYRREQPSSGDIDVIITSPDPETYDKFLDNLVEKSIIVEVLSRGKHKCLVISKIPESEHYRRVDFLFAPPDEYAFSVLYFTGSKGFNVGMRGHALKKGFSMNEHGFTPKVNKDFPAECSIFNFLGLRYIEPKDRLDGRAVIVMPPMPSPMPSPMSSPMPSPMPSPKEDIQPIMFHKKSRKKREHKDTQKKSKKRTSSLIQEPLMEQLVIEERERENERENPIILNKKSRKKREPKQNKSKKNIKNSSVIIENMNITNFKKQGMPVLEVLSEKDLENMIEYANTAYFNEKPVLTDSEYDIVKEFIEQKFPKAEILGKVGAPVSGKNKVTLPFQMPSMDKIKPDSGALESWKTKYKGPYVLSCKLDGVSGLYVCDQKGIYKLYTRGDGIVGQDVSHLINSLRLPTITKGMAVRGEFIIPKKIFTEKYAAEFANARNLVSGIINRKSTDEKAVDIKFITYEVIEPQVKPSEQIRILESVDLNVVKNMTVDEITNKSLSDILVDWRKTYEYEIDGVIVTNDAVYPRVSGNPSHAFAFKMVLSDQIAEAKVVDVEWEASKNGYLKPRVRIEPIRLGGVTIEYATGFNGKFIEDNKIGVGAIIMMIRSGDVIPYIKSVTTPAENPKMPTVPYIWNKTHVDILLENPAADSGVQEKNITLFFTTLEIDGLAKGNVHKLFQAGKTTVSDILKMTEQDFQKIEGFQEKTAKKLFVGIKDKIAAASLLDIMVASGKLGRGLGHKKVAPIIEAFPDILTSTVTPEEKEAQLKSVAGIGPENAREFVKNIPDFLAFITACSLEDKLTQSIHTPTNKKEQTKQTVQGPLTGKKIVMTKVRDPDIISFMTNQGSVLENTMKKDIFVLIVKSKEDKSNKTEYAEKNGIPVMTVEEFKAAYMVGEL